MLLGDMRAGYRLVGNSAVVRFGDTGQTEVISRNATMKRKEGNNANIKGGGSRGRRNNI